MKINIIIVILSFFKLYHEKLINIGTEFLKVLQINIKNYRKK